MIEELMNIKYRLTMDMAAMAASPHAPAVVFKRMVDTLAMP